MSALIARVRKSASERLARNVPMNRRPLKLDAPVVSFSFDDFPRSAWTTGGGMIEAAGGRASYYVAGCFEGCTEDGIEYFARDDLAALHARGHEIGCHTFDHMRLVFETPEAIDASLARNAAFVREAVGDVAMTSFAYPFGHVNLAAKAMIAKRFTVARGIFDRVNVGAADMAQLRAAPIESRSYDTTDYDALVETAQRDRGWLVFFSHDVSDAPSPFGCTPRQLQSVIDRVIAAGCEILPVRDAAARVGAA